MSSHSPLQGKVALVTGASRGIGRAIALGLAQAGADVGVNFRDRAREAEEVAQRIAAMGRRAVPIQADVSRAPEVRRLLEGMGTRLGAIDILVNNAGIARVQKMDEVTEEDWDELLTVNLKSCFLVTSAVLGGMRERGWGRIINVSSIAAQTGGVVGVHYASSKAGILGLTRYYAKQVAAEGITVNAIAPALIETDMTAGNPNAIASNVPAGRLGHVDEVAQVAVMLACNGYLTGQTINVNGGWLPS